MLRRYTTEPNNLTFLGARIWKIVPDFIQKSNNFEEFKLKIKLWNPENCLCRLCERFLPQVGFLSILCSIFYHIWVIFLLVNFKSILSFIVIF